MNSALLQQAAKTLSKCGRRVISPDGLEFIDIPHSCPLYQVTTPASQQITGYRDIKGDTPFLCRAISAVQDVLTWYQVKWPDGKFLSNYLMSLTPNAWAGSFRRSLSREVVCPPESRIWVTTNTIIPNLGASNVALLFEGVRRYACDKSTGLLYALTADQARYYSNPNMNILAPEMDLDLTFPEVPQGFHQVEFRQSSPLALLASPAAQATVSIPSSTAFDYQLRRLEFEAIFPNGVTGELLVLPRDSSGYSLCSDYVPVSLLQNVLLPHYWCVPSGSAILFDFLLQNGAGVGNVTVQAIAVGTAQYRRAA